MRKSLSLLWFKAWITAMAMTIPLETPEPKNAGIKFALYEYAYKIFSQLGEWLADQGFILTVLTAGLFCLYRAVREKENVAVKYSKGTAFLLAVLYAGGKAFAAADSLSAWYVPASNLIKTGILICGFYFFYYACMNLLYVALHSGRDVKEKNWIIKKVCERHPWFAPWCGILFMWAPHLLLRYPGAMGYDNYAQLTYYFDTSTFTTAQPVFHTWLFGSFIRFGTWIGSANLGLFLFVLFQTAVMSAILAYSLLLMRKWETPAWLRMLAMGIYCIAPYYTGYAAFPIKDYLYTAFFVLWVLELMKLFVDRQAFGKRGWNALLWLTAVSFMILCRKNGLYVYLPVALLLFGCGAVMRIKKRESRMWGWRSWIILCLPVILSGSVEKVIMERYQVVQDSAKEMFSLPFQQTARYVRDYGDEVTEEEREAISAVLNYEVLPEVYLEFTSDPVKTTYHADGIEDLANYFAVWFRQFWKHPVCYLEATWNQNYYIFAPNVDNIVYNKDCLVGEEITHDTGLGELVKFEIPKWMQGLAAVAVSWYTLLTRLPVVGMFSNVAFYVILMFCLLLFMMQDRAGKKLIVMLPLLLSFLFVILAPQIQNQPRYAFPIIYTIPSVTGFYLWMIQGKDKRE